MIIRRALPQDLSGIEDLLSQVLEIHHAGRPDLFKSGVRKYAGEQLLEIITDDERPVFVAIDETELAGPVLGYAFCIHQHHPDDNILADVHTLYIDDLCVDEQARSRHVGTRLYNYVLDYAREKGCHNVTLNIWACNEGALRFYEHLGLKPQKYCLERIL